MGQREGTVFRGGHESAPLGRAEGPFGGFPECILRGVLCKIYESTPLRKTKDLHVQGFCSQSPVVFAYNSVHTLGHVGP